MTDAQREALLAGLATYGVKETHQARVLTEWTEAIDGDLTAYRSAR